MAKKIQSSDIFEPKLFDVLLQEIGKAETKLDGLSDKLKGVGKVLKDELGGLDLKSLDSIQKLLDKTKELQKATDDAYKLEKERAKLENQKAILAEKLADTKKKYQLDEEQRLKKISDAEEKRLAKEKKNADDLANAYKQLERSTRELKNESKKLGAELIVLEQSGQKNTKAYRDLQKQYSEVTKQALEGDRALKKLDSQVGDNFRNVGHYEKAVGGLKNMMMQLGVAFGAIDIAKYFIGTQVKLDSLNLALQNVSGSTKEYQSSFGFLKDISLSYGQDLLGLISTYKNFIASTNESNLSLSERKRIYESIVKAGSALALSNDDVQGTLRAVQQMFSKGTVQAEELRQQLGDRLPGAFGLMAKAVGVSEAELGKMMKNGQVLTDEVMPKFAVLLEEEFGKKASRNLETLNGSFNVLKTNLTLYFDSAQKNVGVNKFFASIILLVAKNIDKLLTNLTQLALAFVTYKASAIALNGINAVMKDGFVNVAKSAFTGEKAIKAFGLSLKEISFVLAIDGIIKLTQYYIELAKGTDLARLAYERYQNAQQRGNKKANKFLQTEQDKVTDYRLEQEELRKAGKINEAEFQKRIKLKEEEQIKNYRIQNKELQEKIKLYNIEKSKIREGNKGKAPTREYTNLDLAKIRTQIQEEANGYANKIADQNKLNKLLEKEKKIVASMELYDTYQKLGVNAYELQVQINSINNQIEKYSVLNEKSSVKTVKTANDVAFHSKKVVELNTTFNETNIYISKQIELLKELEILLAKDKEFKAEAKLKDLIEEQNKLIETQMKYDRGAVSTALDADTQAKLNVQQREYNALIEDGINKTAIAYADERDAILDEADKKFKDLKSKEDDYIRWKMDNDKNLKKKLSKASRQESIEMREKLLKDSKILTDAKNKIEEERDKQLKIAQENNTKREKDLLIQQQIDKKNHENKMTEIEVEGETNRRQVLEKLDIKYAEARLEHIKKIATATNDLVQMALESYIKTVERKISMLNDKMNRIAQNSQYLQDKAVAGNIIAQESLAKAQEDQVNAEKQKISYQKSIQRLQIAMTVFNAYNNNIQNAKVGENPFTKTITDVSMLSAFIGSLPQFYTGTETTVAQALGQPQLSGRDGHIIRVDGSEKILNPYLSQKTGDLTTFEIAKIAEDRLKGKLVYNQEVNSTANNMWTNIKLIDEIQDLKTIIKNKPETNIAMGEIVGGVMKIVETTKVSNTTKTNIHRFNKKI